MAIWDYNTDLPDESITQGIGLPYGTTAYKPLKPYNYPTTSTYQPFADESITQGIGLPYGTQDYKFGMYTPSYELPLPQQLPWQQGQPSPTQQTTGSIGGQIASWIPKMTEAIGGLFKQPQIATATPDANTKALEFALANPFDPKTQSWVRSAYGMNPAYGEALGSAMQTQAYNQLQGMPQYAEELLRGTPVTDENGNIVGYSPAQERVDTVDRMMKQYNPATLTEEYWKPEQKPTPVQPTQKSWEVPGVKPVYAAETERQLMTPEDILQSARSTLPSRERIPDWLKRLLPTEEGEAGYRITTPTTVGQVPNINEVMTKAISTKATEEDIDKALNMWNSLSWSINEGYTDLTKMKPEVMTTGGLIEIANTGILKPQSQNMLNDKNLGNAIISAVDNDLPAPDLTPERISSLKDPKVIASLHDTGYVIPQFITENLSAIKKFEDMGLNFNVPETITKVRSSDLKNLINDLSELTDIERQQLIDSNAVLALKTKYLGDTARGTEIYSATWDIQTPKKTTVKKVEEEKQAEIDEYWSAESVAERNKRREESYQWSHAKELEGWGDFYKVMNDLKMPPEMDDYFNSPTRFNELRRQWETVGQGKSWEQFLREYDYEKEWGKYRPSERGERPGVYAPRMVGVSKL